MRTRNDFKQHRSSSRMALPGALNAAIFSQHLLGRGRIPAFPRAAWLDHTSKHW